MVYFEFAKNEMLRTEAVTASIASLRSYALLDLKLQCRLHGPGGCRRPRCTASRKAADFMSSDC
jgi:hypothetical protein